MSEEDIAQVVSMWTGIPLTRLAAEETERLLQMEDALHERIIGQEEAIRRSPRPSAAPAPASRIRGARSARSSSSARPASARR